MKISKTRAGAADLLAGHVVVPRLQPAAGMRPASRRVANQNLWPRPLRLFVRLLLRPFVFADVEPAKAGTPYVILCLRMWNRLKPELHTPFCVCGCGTG